MPAAELMYLKAGRRLVANVEALAVTFWSLQHVIVRGQIHGLCVGGVHGNRGRAARELPATKVLEPVLRRSYGIDGHLAPAVLHLHHRRLGTRTSQVSVRVGRTGTKVACGLHDRTVVVSCAVKQIGRWKTAGAVVPEKGPLAVV